jgi:transposase
LYFLDESGMSNVPNVQRAWSPVGKPHCADASVSRKRVNMLGALDYAANKLIHAVQETSVKRPQVVEFIDRLATQQEDGKPIIVVLDNASIHHHIDEEKIRRWVLDHHLILYYLPPYSPELNPIEILWKQAKYCWRKFTTWTKSDLVREVNKIFQAYGDEFEISYA